MPWARASSLARHLRCPAASWLPRWDRGKWETGYVGELLLPSEEGDTKDTSAADWGTEMHLAKAGSPDANETWMSALPLDVRNKLWPSSLGEHERAYSYSCRTGDVELGPCNESVEVMNEWKNSRPADCVVGTTDWRGKLPTGEPWNDDLKTGWQKPDTDTEAMLFYGLCEQRLTPFGTGRLSITHYPRSKWPKPEDIKRYWLRVGIVQFDLFAEELEKAWKRVRSGMEVVRAGPHCEYCPSVFACPKHKGEF